MILSLKVSTCSHHKNGFCTEELEEVSAKVTNAENMVSTNLPKFMRLKLLSN